ncbi:unnamed protein product [Closterium sp. NIES-54]
MANPRVLRFDAEGRPLKFSVWLLRARRLLESQVQAYETLWAHASGDLPEPADPAPLAADPTPAGSDRYAREHADVTAWKSRDAAAYIALSSLLPESEETHFTQVRTASEFLTTIKARYTSPTTVSLGRVFLPFLFPDLASFERTADLITHLHLLDSSYRAACTDAQLALLPPPMAITLYFIATSLPDRLSSIRDALLLKHPSELTIEVLESALKDVESNLRSVASASCVVPPPLFHGCTVPQLPTFTASLATAATDVTAAAFTTSSRSRGRSGRRSGQGAGGGGGGGEGDVASGGGGSAGAGGAPRTAAGDSPAPAGGRDARVRQPPTGLSAAGGGAAAWYLTRRQQQQPLPSQQPQQQQRQQQVSGQGSGQRQLQRGVVHPPCTYHVLTGARRSHPPDIGPGAAPENASLSFTLDSGASHCFFPDRTTLTPLPTPVSVALADPPLGLVTTRYTTTLSCPAVPSGSLTGFHVPSFSRNLVGVRPLVSQHVGVWIEPSSETAVCVDGDTYAPLATFTAELDSGHYTLHTGPRGQQQRQQQQQQLLPPTPVTVPRQVPTSQQVVASPQVAVSGQVLVSGPVVASCSCRSLAHPTVLRVGCAPPLNPPPFVRPPSPSRLSTWTSRAPPPAPPERESFFLVVVDDYSRYTTVFPLAKKSDMTSPLIRWLLTTADTRGRRVSCLHSDHGVEFRSGILAGIYREQGIRQSWTLPESLQQNGVAERRIGLVMEIARTSRTHAHPPHFLWPYAARYTAHQLNLWPRVSRPEVSPTNLSTRSPGAASRFRVWGCLALVRDTSADKILPRAVPCVFLSFPENSSDYTFYHRPLHRFFDSRDVRFDESVPYYVRYPCRGLPVPPAPLFLTSAPSPAPPVQPPPPWSCYVMLSFAFTSIYLPSYVRVFHATLPLSVAPQVQPPPPQSSSQPTADPAGAGFCGEDPGGTSSRGAGVGAESEPVRGPSSGGAGVGAEPATAGDSSLRGAGVSGAVPGSATTGGASSAGPGEPGTDPVTSGSAGSRGSATGSLESSPGATTAPDTTPPPHPFLTRHQARQQQQQQQQQPEHEQPQQQQQPPPPPVSGLRTLGLPSPSPTSPPSPPVSGPPLPPLDPSPAVFPPPLPPLSPPLSHTCSSRRSPCARPSSPLPFTNLRTALFRSSPPRLSPSVLPSPPDLALTASLSTHVTDYYRTYRPVLSRALASLVTDPHASLSSVSALTAAATEFASTRCLDYATSLVAAPPTSPLAVGGESALGCDALEERQFELEFLAAASPHLCAMLLAPEGDPDAFDIPTPRTYAKAVSRPWASQWRGAMDSEMASYRSTGTYVDEVPPLGANVVDGMWIFKWRLRRPVYGLRPAPREWYDTLRSTLSYLGFQPSSADPSLFVRRGSTPFFVLVYVDDLVFATAVRVALADVKLELQKRHSCTDLGNMRHYLGLQITRDRAARTITLSQSHMVQQVLQRFELQHSTVQRTPLAVDHRLTGPFPDESFEPSGPYAELVGCLMYLMTFTRLDPAFPLSILAHFVAPGRHRPVHWTAAVRVAKYLAMTSGVELVLGGRQDVVLTGHCDSSYADDAKTQRSTQGYCFSLGSGAVSWRSTRSSSVSTSTAEAEIYAGAMAA